MTLIAITGASGRMGKNIISCIKENPLATLSAAIEMPGHASIGKDAGVIAGLEHMGVKITDEPSAAFKKADVVIDFSAHEAAMKNLEVALMLRKPVVIGTTGFSLHQKVRIKEISAAVPLVLAPNMSVGVNVLLKLLEVAAKTLGDDYDVEIVEYHHRHKVDAPSGTALRIAEVLAHSLGRDLDKVAVYGRKGITGERKKEEIGIQ
ncbi:MAG: 4-hydroxy-tetrahydrodipicolinate reductase, partial [Deltaproteobacteria bacterium]